MSKIKVLYFSIGIIYLFIFGISLQAQTPDTSVENKQTNQGENARTESVSINENDLIHFGDLIDVDVIGSTEYDWRGKLSPEGFLSGINFAGDPIYGLCRTESEVASDVAKGFGKILNNPKVNVKILDRSGRPISQVFGAVKTPQRFQIRRPVRLNELIILSGGFTENASGEIQIVRSPNLSCKSVIKEPEIKKDEAQETVKLISTKAASDSQFININISDLITGMPEANPLIFTGDIINVKEAQPIYVTGGVVNPRQLSASGQLTLSRAVSSAGGFTKDADPKRIIIFRREKDGIKTINVDFEKIADSIENDITLQALDIVEIPKSGSERRRFEPVIKAGEKITENSLAAPLRIID